MLAQFPSNVIRMAVPSGLRADVRAELERLERLRVEALQDAAPSDARDFLRVMSVVALKQRGGKVAHLRPVIEECYGGAMAIVDALDLPPDNFQEMINRLGSQSATLENAAAFINEFRDAAKAKKLAADLETFPSSIAPLLAPIITLIRNPESDNAYALVQKQIGVLKQPDIASAYNATTTEKLGGADDLQQNLHDLAEQLVGKRVNSLTAEQSKALRESNPEGYRQFMKTKQSLKQRCEAAIREVVQASGKNLLTCREVSEKLEAEQVPNPWHKQLQKTRYVFVNHDGQLCDKRGVVLNLQGTQSTNKLEFNPDPNPDPSTKGKAWIFRVLDPKQNNKVINQSYPVDYTQARKGARFEKVSDTNANIDKIKKKWRAKMNGDPNDETTLFAYIAELMYWTAMRPASREGMTAGNRTYGTSNFLVKHVSVGGHPIKAAVERPRAANVIKLKFPAKSMDESEGQFFRCTLSANDPSIPADEKRYVRALVNFIVKKCQGKSADDVVFSDANGRSPQMGRFNSFIRSIGASISGSGFRKLRGTEEALKQLDVASSKIEALAKKGKVSDTAIKTIFLESMTEVGKLLGHMKGENPTPLTAIKQYIDPKVMLQWFKGLGDSLGSPVAVPKQVLDAAKAAGIDV